ncbi:MAG: glycosyltransferase [Gammaproteobacteria bacterium]|nr:glycosyltransferase [Gammaproteobacteria bacterium]
MFAGVVATLAAALWLGALLAPWRPCLTREFLEATPGSAPEPLRDVSVLIPARDEAGSIDATLDALLAQGGSSTVIVIDDLSKDATAEKARNYAGRGVTLVPGTPPPPGWTGKLWALEQGRRFVRTPLVLLLDADIEMAPGMLAAMRRRLRSDDLSLLSLMATLRMETFWEKLLMPAFVFFFKLIYPFRLSNSRSPHVAAAAGGCVLLRTQALDEIGGFARIRSHLIDDCALARAFKAAGLTTWIGLSRSVRSRRSYPRLAGVWGTVARTAYTQLRRSPTLLLCCSVVMITAFLAPLAGVVSASPPARAAGAAALVAMCLCYAPVLRYYRRSLGWCALLPFIGMLYLMMTWSSAMDSWRGRGAVWRGRVYGSLGSRAPAVAERPRPRGGPDATALAGDDLKRHG